MTKIEMPVQITLDNTFESHLSLVIDCSDGRCWPCLRIETNDIKFEVALTIEEAERLASCLYRAADFAESNLPYGHDDPPESPPYEKDFFKISEVNYSE